MKNAAIILLWIAFIVLNSNIADGQTQLGHSPLEANLAPESTLSERNAANPNVIWTEDIEARTLTTATYLSNDGQIKIDQSARPINYYNSSNILVPIDAKLRKNADNSWSAANQPQPTYLFQDGSYALTIDKTAQLRLGKKAKIGDQFIESKVSLSGNTATYYNVIPGVDKELIFYENAVKSNYILHEFMPDLQEDLVFSELLELPANCKIVEDKTYGKRSKDAWNGDMLIVDESGATVATFHLPVCYDAANKRVTGSYRVREENGAQFLEMIIPKEWLTDPFRVYPVVVDPLVVGPTAPWLGGNMPSCIMPAYNQDSIFVTIPGGVTVTGLYVTASFYADPFTPAVMADGAMFFSTDCDNSQSFVITGVPGESAGTAYLDSFNLYNPLTCCMPESCSPQNFYLSMHLGRSALGAGCNETYIRHDIFTTSWPFRATVLGRTPEPYASEWNVQIAPRCSNECEITGRAYVQYGVAPYTFTHPWSTDTIVQGTNVGCSSGGNNYDFSMTIPSCPSFCDPAYTSLNVIPPTIVDACGTLVTGFPIRIMPIKMTPDVTAIYDTLVCSGDPFMIDLTSCSPTATISWTQGWEAGSTDIFDTIVNTLSTITTLNYTVSASENGCFSDTLNLPMHIQPLPIPNYTNDPEELIAGLPITFSDASIFNASPGVTWLWIFGDGGVSTDQNPSYTYALAGQYNLCLIVENQDGCLDSICQMVTVYPAEVIAPNIITANNDGINDFLEFRFLDFYPNNTLTILNRWGVPIHEESGYENDWNGPGLNEGTYFYILTILGEEEVVHEGFFQIVK
jgi:gliding motility-associated-like protein